MATLKLVSNGARRTATKRVTNPKRRTKAKAKRNPTTATTAKVARVTRRNPTTLKAVSNRRKTTKRRRRNGAKLSLRSNGLLGNTKATSKAVGSLLAGLVITRVEGSILSPVAARILAQLGLSSYADALVQAGLAVTVNRWAAKQFVGQEGANMVMIGGLAMAVMSLIQNFLPQTSVYNPFASSNVVPVVLPTNQVSAQDAARIAAGVAAANAAKVGAIARRPSIVAPRY